MKFFLNIFLSIAITSCVAQKQSTLAQKITKKSIFYLASCPENYECNLEITPNTSLQLKKDKFNFYYANFIDSDSILIKYKLKRKKAKNTVDGHLTEVIYFNISKSDTELNLNNHKLQKINLILYRQCYCKGTTGYFKITDGNFNLNIKKNELTLNIDFSVENIPHVLHKINEKVIFEP